MLEVCPTSNDLLQVVETIEDHPLPDLIEAGLSVSINTDDPGWFATDLVTELQIAADLLGLDESGLVALQRGALDASFASDALKQSIGRELDDHEPGDSTVSS